MTNEIKWSTDSTSRDRKIGKLASERNVDFSGVAPKPYHRCVAGYQRIDPPANACGSTAASLTAFRERTVIGATMVRTIVYVTGEGGMRHAHESSETEKECGDGCGFEREQASHAVSPGVRVATPEKIELPRRKGIAET
jgi:hypothetical protein